MKTFADNVKAYLNQLNLNFDPFEPGTLSRDFFVGGNRQLLLDQLLELSLYGSAIVSVTGCLGSGKTTLAQALENSYSEEAVCIRIAASLFMNQAQFLEQLVIQLDLNPSVCANDESTLREICQLATQLDLEARTIIVIIDDAHELSSEVLEVISLLLQTAPESSIRALLLGEPQLGNLLHNTLLLSNESNAVELELDGFGVEETAEYIEFKLTTAGYEGGMPINGDDLGSIQNNSNGMPGTINALITDILANMAYENVLDPMAVEKIASPPLHYWAAAAALVVLLFGCLMFWESPTQVEFAVASYGIFAGEPDQQVAVVAESPLSDPQLSASSSLEVEALQTEAPEIVTRQAASESYSELAVNSGIGLVEQQSLPAENVNVQMLVEEIVAETSQSSTTQIASSVSLATAPVSTVTNDGPTLRSFERVLLNYPVSHYIVQVLGSRSETNVQNFLDQEVIVGTKGYFETRYQDKPWFVVVFGNFNTRDTASAAIDQLPASLQERNPWVRSLSGIQEEIRQRATQLSARN